MNGCIGNKVMRRKYMKLNKICVCILFFVVSLLYAEDIWFFPPNTYIQHISNYKEQYKFEHVSELYGDILQMETSSYPYIVSDGKSIFFYIPQIRAPGIKEIKRNRITLNDNLYQEILFDGGKYLLIEGGGYFATTTNSKGRKDREADFSFFRKMLLEKKLGFYPVYNGVKVNEFFGYIGNDENEKDVFDEDLIECTDIMPNIVARVRISVPYLQEIVKGKKIIYDDEMLQYRWMYFYTTERGNDAFFINTSKPMVEGAAGNGTGLVLDIDFHIPSDNLVVLNGFVDTDRPHLYKMNARMKTVRVQGDGFDFEYTFKDYVHFAQIDFPKQVTKVQLTVTDVYDGEKWEDMAISGLWVNPDILKTANTDLAREYLKHAEKISTE